ncbi:uncharacterized protein RJT21DRAFT_122014 [Scheffersomyces amazonensis]|uniref:uncharacterized protein n=1 Tax=Scheffersomyces amazonensis TaxID=1078765 RepID=UPI00315D4448
MKIISEEEKAAHRQYVLTEGLKGCVIGVGVAYGITRFVKYRYPVRFSQMNASIKAAMWAMPTITIGAFFADEGSLKFDTDTYRAAYLKKIEAAQEAKYNNLSTSERMLEKLNEKKYETIVAAWAASLYGSWKLVDRDPYMTRAQKLVQARVYAQAFTVVLLLGTIVLSVHTAEVKKKSKAPVEQPEWKKYLDEHGNDGNTTPQPHIKH